MPTAVGSPLRLPLMRYEADFLRAFGMQQTPYTELARKPADEALVLRIYQCNSTRLLICPLLAGGGG